MADVTSERERDTRQQPGAPLESLDAITGLLPFYRDAIQSVREILLANLVMIGEIPAPTFGEGPRVEFIQNRFTECGLHSVSTDEMGNALGIVPGSSAEQSILVVAHVDTVFPANIDHNITLSPDAATGPGVGDNALGAAVIVTLPTLLNLLEIELRSNLVLMGASRSLGRGDLDGLRFFLSNADIRLAAGIGVEGFPLGRLSHESIGMFRGELAVRVPEAHDWTRFGAVGAIGTLNDVIQRILEIRLPRRPRSTIVLGSIEGGKSYSTISTEALLRFEVRTDSEEIGQEIVQQLEDIASDVSSQTGAEVVLDIFARRRPGGISFRHPLVRATRRIMRALEIEPHRSPVTSEVAAFSEHGVPAVTIGVTHGEHQNQPDEVVQIEPVSTGLAQLVGILLAIDGGFCRED